PRAGDVPRRAPAPLLVPARRRRGRARHHPPRRQRRSHQPAAQLLLHARLHRRGLPGARAALPHQRLPLVAASPLRHRAPLLLAPRAASPRGAPPSNPEGSSVGEVLVRLLPTAAPRSPSKKNISHGTHPLLPPPVVLLLEGAHRALRGGDSFREAPRRPPGPGGSRRVP